MDYKWSVLFLLIVQIVDIHTQDVPSKIGSKLSDFKAKLAKTELSTKSSATSQSDEESFSGLGISSVPPEYANDTIKKDYHTYYNSTFYSNPDEGKKFWINLDELPEKHVVMHEKLSDSYRQATTVELSFDFPFYGSLLRNVTIATGGFLYMGDYLHNWIAATQYVAPLMANFDTRLSADSVIKYADNGTAFTVQWEKVHIQNRESDGAFTFQATLLKNGDIIFAYKDIPYAVNSISDSQHPVKVGLSDAYILERSILYIRRKTVYEYNRIHVTDWGISNNTALYFTALPTCNIFKDCATCVSSGVNLECLWCESVKRCSDGIDRQRQSWVEHGCSLMGKSVCPAEGTVTPTAKSETNIVPKTNSDASSNRPKTSKTESSASMDISTASSNSFESNEVAAHLVHGEENSESQSRVSAAAITTILVFLAVITAVFIWIYYAYKNPQSSSGQFLIKYRPSQWTVKKESTVATSNSRHL